MDRLRIAPEVAAAVRAAGAVPAAIGLIDGAVVVGLSEGELARLADPGRAPAKAASRDLAALLLTRRDAGTTVSATAAIAARAGIRLFATGGIGGVHRLHPGAAPRAAGDVSADLAELAHSPVCVVSAGLLRLHWLALGRPEGVLLAVAPPQPLPRVEVEAAIEAALAGAANAGVTGPAVTPWLLAAVAQASGGRTLEANLALLERNAQVAGEVAVALSRPG